MADRSTQNRNSFGYWLFRYRLEVLHYTQARLADELFSKRSFVQRLELNRRARPSQLNKLAIVLQIRKEFHERFYLFGMGLLRPTHANYELVLGEVPPLESVHELLEYSDSDDAHSIKMEFDFPEAVRVPCEQYLLYFVQFLKDVGVDATANISEDAGRTLFTVTPCDDTEALDIIRRALELYLKLPTHTTTALYSDREAQQLAANVHRLRADLAVASAFMETQRTTIEAQRTTIEAQKQLLSGTVVVQSMVSAPVAPEPKDKEQVLDGLVSITPYEGEGFEINLPEMLRRVRGWFQRRK